MHHPTHPIQRTEVREWKRVSPWECAETINTIVGPSCVTQSSNCIKYVNAPFVESSTNIIHPLKVRKDHLPVLRCLMTSCNHIKSPHCVRSVPYITVIRILQEHTPVPYNSSQPIKSITVRVSVHTLKYITKGFHSQLTLSMPFSIHH